MSKNISRIIEAIDGRGYKQYKRLVGAIEEVDGIVVRVVRVQGDPFAPPSTVRLEAHYSFPEWSTRYPIALADWVYRRLYGLLKRYSRKRGEGRSGFLGLPEPGPVMLRRSGVELADGRIVARVWVGLPSRRRRVLGGVARELLLEVLPSVFRRALDWRGFEDSLREHIVAWRLQEYLRARLLSKELVSFIGDGSILPRKCGGCHEPLRDAVPFESPPSLRVEFDVPWLDTIVSGMGVRKGLTVIMGSAFHGKTTLLEAIAAGVWNHIPGDGRERVVTIRNAVSVRAEDGRFISCTDISSFIHDLPGGRDTRCFTTVDASGATSTAASIQEAVEAGASLILLDEDNVATNILYSDERAEELVEHKTVTPLSMLANGLKSNGVSVVIASSGNLNLLSVADTVILMDEYHALDITVDVRRLVRRYGLDKLARMEDSYILPRTRLLEKPLLLVKPRVKGRILTDKKLPVGVLIDNPQLVEEAQYNTIIELLRKIKSFTGKSFREISNTVDEEISRGFRDLLRGEPSPGLAEIRGLDFVYVLNRLPGIKVVQRGE